MAPLFTRDTRLPIFLLFIFSLLLYNGILQNSWHLDDSGNILHNAPLHITDLRLSTLLQTFYAHPESTGKLYRPISNLTFALNWYFGQNKLIGYHLVDIIIHGVTAIVLYLTCLQLFKTPALTARDYSQTEQRNIALLTAALWLAAPIHTSAVTYIVQRMAQLAAFFSLAAIFFYLKARVSNNRLHQTIFSTSCLCCIFLALGSKENAILIFPSLGLVEGIFFLQFTKIQEFAQQKRALFSLLFLLVTGITFYLSWDFIAAQANSYGHRNFTFQERLLTEPRILLFYLSQIFYPTASRLSITHDITVSTSLFSPWQTLPAIFVCFSLIVFAISKIYKRPLLSFALLYYFLNHLVESTIIPLELIFEHRNLLPSLFLFLPITAFLTRIINTKKWATILTGATCVLFLFQSGYATIERNKAWKNTGTLNEDALVKAPASARVKLNLASWYATQKNFEEALSLCEEAEQLEASGASRNTIIPIARMQQGSIFYELGQSEKAIKYFREAYSLRKDYTAAAEKLIAVLIERKYYDEAQQVITERYT
ncbi:MAG: hypothetical protein D3908_06765, partial [Candidatus Electrothrix sp. AUS4]|nr:hypothetical protein [Candidatus Electrothrix sp. AUS4]